MIDLLNYRENKFSQNGEDGIIRFILSQLNIKNGFFVEFGAADGKICSNTWSLVEKGWSGIYIEPDENFYNTCIENSKAYENVKCLRGFVKISGENSLDKILSRNEVEKNFDILSIDVDGDDYRIWDSLSEFKPKIVIIEINSAIPEGFLQIHNPPEQICTSFSSMISLAEKKGYKPLCHTGNLFFIDKTIEFPEVNFYMLKDWIGRFKNPYKLTN